MTWMWGWSSFIQNYETSAYQRSINDARDLGSQCNRTWRILLVTRQEVGKDTGTYRLSSRTVFSTGNISNSSALRSSRLAWIASFRLRSSWVACDSTGAYNINAKKFCVSEYQVSQEHSHSKEPSATLDAEPGR